MTTKNRFEDLICRIELAVTTMEGQKPRDIVEAVVSDEGSGYRDINTIFTYLTGMSIMEYARERQLMSAYTFIINAKFFDIDRAVLLSGFDNQSSFGKRFKERFGMPPKEAFNRKDYSLITAPLGWDGVSSGQSVSPEPVSEKPSGDIKFGLPREQYDLIQEAADTQALFGMSDIRSEAAFEIAIQDKVPMTLAFSFVDDYCTRYDYHDGDINFMGQDLRGVLEMFPDERYVYFNVIPEISTSIELAGEIVANGARPRDFSPEYLQHFMKNEYFNFPEFQKLASIYIDAHGHLDSYFDRFLTEVGLGSDIYDVLFEDDYMDILMDYDSPADIARDVHYTADELWLDKFNKYND